MSAIKLNQEQLEAVNTIYGPVLVIAGPGTGKTQLLSSRIANILEKTDVNPQNILCLTFTEAAAQNMRDRLASLIKDDAYDVHISTYHGFGSEIIKSYPEYFEKISLEKNENIRLEKPIDELTSMGIISDILEDLPYSSSLKSSIYYPRDVISTINELKNSQINPENLNAIADENLKAIYKLSPKINDILSQYKRMPSKATESIALFSSILNILKDNISLVEHAKDELKSALDEAESSNKSKPLTAWKNSWTTKDSGDNYVFTNPEVNKKLKELSVVYKTYQSTLDEQGLYDYNDMILRTIEALKDNDNLRYTLQEKYQFVLLDEFQDTNSSQFEIVKQLSNNPVNENKPNVFAVGDDDQAIYAFQGAKSSNMIDFVTLYNDVKVVNLTKNYRSHKDVIHTAHNVASQIESRLQKHLEDVDKTLEAASPNLPNESSIERHTFTGQANELAWVANRISELVNEGVDPSNIAVLAPKHKYLESIVPFLVSKNIPISYEKRENILNTPIILSLKMMAELVIACRDTDTDRINELAPKVLSLNHYDSSTSDIWKINWAFRSDRTKNWVQHAQDYPGIAKHLSFYLELGLRADIEPLEHMLDFLTGANDIEIDSDVYKSPLKDYYFKDSKSLSVNYYEALANLSTIRKHIRSNQNSKTDLMKIEDFIRFIDSYEEASQPLLNTHPIAQSSSNVELMTVYKSKGLEFEHVFLLSVHDDVWGKKSRSNKNKISLPANLQDIRYRGSDEDELRRLLFVAITRSKHGLYLTSHELTDDGKQNEPVKYLLEYVDDDNRIATVLPENKQTVNKLSFAEDEMMQQVETLWQSRHLQLNADLTNLLNEKLGKYKMPPTHLNTFIDLEYGGPEKFLLNSILNFPQAPTEDGEFGNAIHETLDFYQKKINSGENISIENILVKYESIIRTKYIAAERMQLFIDRGVDALTSYIKERSDMFKLEAASEVDFSKEGVLVDKALLSGKIDRLEIDKEAKTIRIVDYKTGKPSKKWNSTVKLLKYKQQLYFYKFLVEKSHTWSSYKVIDARLEYTEQDEQGNTAAPLLLNFDHQEEVEMKKLISCVWKLIMEMKLPDVTNYSNDYKGSMQFISYLTIESDPRLEQ